MNEALRKSSEERFEEGRSLVKADTTAVARESRDPYASLSLGSASLDEGNDLAVTLRQYAYMVVKRRWLILSIALAFFVLGGVRVLFQTPLYTATVRMQIEREAAKIVEGGTTSPVESGSTDFLRNSIRALEKPKHGRACRVDAASL